MLFQLTYQLLSNDPNTDSEANLGELILHLEEGSFPFLSIWRAGFRLTG